MGHDVRRLIVLGILITAGPAAAFAEEKPMWWSLRPIARPDVPTCRERAWIRTPVDAFILAKLEAKGLAHSPDADRVTLLRRVTFDLRGLPPTPEEVDAFVADQRPDAWERVIDRLLASPRYGERWGRHWLDVVHYGDTHGYDKDKRRDNAWRYRDYVIDAFNADKPYARFIREQLAGDVLFPGDRNALIATGFIAAGPWDFVGHVELREGTVDKEKTRALDRDDMVTTTAASFLSVTAGCARCHDHKFDPIPQLDYYRLQSVFAGVDRGERELPGEPKAKTYAVLPIKPRPVHLLSRGDVERPKAAVAPGALSCVVALPSEFKLSNSDDEGNRRAALAEWIADSRNPLTWRSIANRIWHYHFGRGIVDTPGDFGRNGGLPTHPELLDWLAAEFRDGGGSFKKLHRLLLTSAVYRQSVRHEARATAIDGDNRLLWRMNRARLDAESLRDSILAISGKLDLRMGGPAFEPFQFKDDHSPIYDHAALEKIHDPATYRRTVYRFVVRSVPHPLLDSLDCADPNVNTPVRNTTLTALQALALLNDPFLVRQAEFLAERLKPSGTANEQLDLAYRLLLARRPTTDEAATLEAFSKRHGMSNTCRLLLNLNEFVFVD